MSTPAFQHVLVPVDFSPCSDKALELALDIARTTDAKLTLLHVVYVPPAVYAAYQEAAYWPAFDIERDERKAFEALLEKTRQVSPDVKVDGVVATGKPWRKILEMGLKLDADLIVMGTTGRTGLAHALLGSVAEKIVRLSPIPVLTACLEGGGRNTSHQDVKAASSTMGIEKHA
jgi:nucleotide-binding universal stress UspA family protein